MGGLRNAGSGRGDGRAARARRAFLMAAGAAALLVSGCAWPTSITYTWQGRADDLAEARAAADEWNLCPGIHIDVEAGGDGVPIVEVAEIPGLPAGQEGHTHTVDHAPTWIHYVHSDEPGHVRAIMAHEMGHALGLYHSSNDKDIMYFEDKTENHVTEANCRALP